MVIEDVVLEDLEKQRMTSISVPCSLLCILEMFVPFQGKRKGWQLTQFVGASNQTFWEKVGRNMALIASQKTVDLREIESNFWRWKDLEETRVS